MSKKSWGEPVKIERRRREILRKNKTEILNFLSRVKHVSASLVVIFILFVYFFIYRTMAGESQQALIDKFVETGNLNAHLLDHTLERAEESARSLSSRTMISEAIVDYLDGEKTLEELKRYTKDKYEDGAQALDNILYAERVVGEESIAEYYGTDAAIPEYPLELSGAIDTVTTTIDVDKSTVFIRSPIVTNRGVIGEDHLTYGVKDELESLATEEIKVGLWCEKRHQNILEKSHTLEANDHWRLFETATDFYAEYPVKDKYFYTKIAKTDLFYHINLVVKRIMVGSLLIFIIASGFVYYFIVRYAKKKLVKIDASRREFKYLAYFDQLTGAYTRSFLDVWDQHDRETDQLHALILVDLNDFKTINDTYGHLEGDAALKEVGKTFREHLRSQDLVVRYGGDEFVLILPDLTADAARKVVERVEKHLPSIPGVSTPLTFAYGISSFKDGPIEEAIKKADRRMYEDKIRKKNQSTKE